VKDIPGDAERLAEEAEGHGPLDRPRYSVAGLADPDHLLRVLEANLDRPAIPTAGDQLCGRGRDIGRDQRDPVALLVADLADQYQLDPARAEDRVPKAMDR